ncbi:major capsid protein P3 [Pterostylis polerovirus]|nr:major capsid protein P3 [Pterostylis polerovirus]
MNTVVVRRNRNGRRRRRPRGYGPVVRTQPVVVVAGNRVTRGRRRRRRVRGGPGRIPGPGLRGSSETFVFSKDSLKGSSAGSFTFGPSLSDCPAFKDGILRAYHEYKITMVTLQFVSEASSTAAGSFSYELDPHCKITSLASTINKFTITKGGVKTYQARLINGEEWHDSSEDQFRILYKGNGDSTTAGSFKITIRVALQNPK